MSSFAKKVEFRLPKLILKSEQPIKRKKQKNRGITYVATNFLQVEIEATRRRITGRADIDSHGGQFHYGRTISDIRLLNLVLTEEAMLTPRDALFERLPLTKWQEKVLQKLSQEWELKRKVELNITRLEAQIEEKRDKMITTFRGDERTDLAGDIAVLEYQMRNKKDELQMINERLSETLQEFRREPQGFIEQQ